MSGALVGRWLRARAPTHSRRLSLSAPRTMKLLQFRAPHAQCELRTGVLSVDGCSLADVCAEDPSLPGSLLALLQGGHLPKLACIANSNYKRIPLSSVYVDAPITGMDKVICVGLNYKDHCEEQKLTPPDVPMFFSKFASCVIGPCDSVKLRTKVTETVDWEVELAVVIGKMAVNVDPACAYDYVLGYTVAQDISARDWQKKRNGGQFLLGKSMDTFCPLGPWIVTTDEICNPECLGIKCCVNGILKQNSNTSQLINKIPDLISRLSWVMTLCPGDIILTGTPGGVGMYRQPPEYLKPGDIIESVIDGIGLLTTRVEEFC